MSIATASSTLPTHALNEEKIRQQVAALLDSTRASGSSELLASIEVLQSVRSTNSYLLEKPIVSGKLRVCAAESQISGRGRRGNDWQSAANKNIMLSLSWGFKQWPDTITGLGLAVALLVAERLNHEYRLGVEIKWPNDLLIRGDKLAGILVDVTGDANGACNVVIGLGLNVHQPDWSAQTADYAWTDLMSHGIQPNRNDLLGFIIGDCLTMLVDFEQQGFGPMIDRWNALSCHANQQIVLQEADAQIVLRGRMLGVNEVGALLVESDGEQRTINNSNLSLRLA